MSLSRCKNKKECLKKPVNKSDIYIIITTSFIEIIYISNGKAGNKTYTNYNLLLKDLRILKQKKVKIPSRVMRYFKRKAKESES
jgi:hypothetical protein